MQKSKLVIDLASLTPPPEKFFYDTIVALRITDDKFADAGKIKVGWYKVNTDKQLWVFKYVGVVGTEFKSI